MKIVILGGFSFPTGMAASARIRNLAHGFQENGAEVWVIAQNPPFDYEDYPVREWIDFAPGIHLIYSGDQTPGMKSLRLRKRVSYFKALRSGPKLLSELIQREAIDAVFLYGRSYLLFRQVLKLTQNQNITTVLDVVELPTLEMGPLEYFIHPFTVDSYLSYKWITPRIDILTSITTALQEMHSESTASKYLLPSIEGWPHEVQAYPKNDNEAIFTFTYVGALLTKDAPDQLFLFIKSLINRGVIFRINILGRYDRYAEGREWRKKFEEELSFRRVINWIGETTDKELSQHLATSDGLILLRQNRKVELYSFPTRLVEYLKTGNPVFITEKGDIPIYLQHLKTACFLHSTDIDSSLDDVITVMNNKEMARQIGQAGFALGQKMFNRNYHAKLLMQLINSVKEGTEVSMVK